jgi:hypothetical protein
MTKAELIGQTLQAIADANKGRLTPDGVLKAAKSPKSPLHSEFEWDDSVAAYQFRLEQARRLIRSVEIKVETFDIVVRGPKFVRDPDAGSDQGYIDTSRLRRDADGAREAVVHEFACAAAALTRARSVAAVLGLADQVDDLRNRVVGLANAAREARAGAT